MALSIKELDALLTVLSVDVTDHQSFESIATNFHQLLPKVDSFKTGSALVLLLQQSADLLPSQTQRLAASFLLFEIFRNEPIQNNPFISCLTQLVHQEDPEIKDEASGKPSKKRLEPAHGSMPKLSRREKHFVGQLLAGSVPLKDLMKATPKMVLAGELSQSGKEPDIGSLMVHLVERQTGLPFTAKAGIPVVIADPETKSYKFR